MTDIEKQELLVSGTGLIVFRNVSPVLKVVIHGQEICNAEDWEKVKSNYTRIETELLSSKEKEAKLKATIKELREALEFIYKKDIELQDESESFNMFRDATISNAAKQALLRAEQIGGDND